MPLAFKVQCNLTAEFTELMEDLRAHNPLLDRVNEHKRILSHHPQHVSRSRVTSWANAPLNHEWKSNPDFLPPVKCDLVNHTDQLVHSIKRNKVVIVEAETGSGKSIVAPSIAYMACDQIFQEDNSISENVRKSGFRGIHMTPTGEQAIQNGDHVRKKMMDACEMVIGSHCAALTYDGENRSNIIIRTTNYLYCTQFFGVHALETGTLFHVVVLDEVHELTPSVLYLLYLIRERLKDGSIFRVLLLSATMPSWLKRRIIDYFSLIDVNVDVVTCGRSPYPVTIMDPGNDEYSFRALQTSEKKNRLNDFDIFTSEGGNIPNTKRMRSRCLEYSISLSDRYLNIDIDMIPDNPGCLVFLPGSADTVLATTDMKNWRKRLPITQSQMIDVMTVNGDERKDIKTLTDELDGLFIRNVFSTPLLSTGVTVLGIDNVVDSGMVKICGYPNLRGIVQLHTVWIDKNMRKQRMGRVGRLRPGFYYPCYSNKRAQMIEESDWTKTILMSKFNTADLVPLLNYYKDFLIVPQKQVLDCILLEAGLQGFFDINLELDSDIRLPRMDILANTIFHCLSGVSLDCGLFLMNCASYGCLLSGMIYVASHQCRHAAIKKPSGKQTGRYGRDDRNLLMNWWPEYFGSAGSDIQIYCEILLNVWMNIVGYKVGDNPFPDQIYYPKSVKSDVNVDGLFEVHRSLCGLANGLIAAGIITEISDILLPDFSGLLLENVGEYTIVRLNYNTNNLFSIAITSSFGSRVLSQRDQRGYNHTTFCLTEETQPGSEDMKFVQGERAKQSHPDEIAVYHSIYMKDNEENFFTALIHQCSSLDYLIFGNSYGSYNDRVDMDRKTLTVNTATGSVLFQFDSATVLDHICWFRKLMKLQPTARFYSNRFNDLLSEMALINFHKFLTVSHLNNSHLSIPSIDDWEDCARVGIF